MNIFPEFYHNIVEKTLSLNKHLFTNIKRLGENGTKSVCIIICGHGSNPDLTADFMECYQKSIEYTNLFLDK